jgi:hypothetical protein
MLLMLTPLMIEGRLNPEAVLEQGLLSWLEKPQGSVNLEAGCLVAPSTKTRLTKVLTGITEDYCYKKTKILVLLSPAFQ